MQITGILPPMVTPFRENGEVFYDAFVRNIERWNDTPLSGYLVLGSNSETPYLNEGEKLQLIRLTAAAAPPGRVILAGTGCESTAETIRLTNAAARAGAHAALILTPSYYGSMVSDAGFIRHFTAIADACDIPILIYNVPRYTHLNVSVEVVRTLSRHPRIIGMKDSRGDLPQLQAFKQAVPDSFSLIAGSSSVLYPALEIGVRAAILALANCLPAQCVEVMRLFERGDRDGSRALHERLLAINKSLIDTYGIAGLKYAASVMGFEGGYPRSPMLPVSDAGKAAIRDLFDRAQIDHKQVRTGPPSSYEKIHKLISRRVNKLG